MIEGELYHQSVDVIAPSSNFLRATAFGGRKRTTLRRWKHARPALLQARGLAVQSPDHRACDWVPMGKLTFPLVHDEDCRPFPIEVRPLQLAASLSFAPLFACRLLLTQLGHCSRLHCRIACSGRGHSLSSDYRVSESGMFRCSKCV